MTANWITISNLAVGGVGAIAAVVAAWASLKVYHRQREADDPLVSAHLTGTEDAVTLELHVVNQSISRWVVDSLEILKPRHVLGYVPANHYEYDTYGGIAVMTDSQIAEALCRKVPIEVELFRPGSRHGAGAVGPADECRREIVMLPARAGKYVMGLRLRSADARERTRTIKLKRRLRSLAPRQ